MMKRRDFLKAAGALSSASMLSACGKKGEPEKLISYLVPPEEGVIPGEAVFTPSTCTECPAHCGLRVKTIDGFPRKLEGNPGHPVNHGALCMRGQAALFRLYHPDRIRTPLIRDAGGDFQPIPWEKALEQITTALRGPGKKKHLYLSGRTTGTLVTMIDKFCKTAGIERAPEFEPYSHGALRTAYGRLFGTSDLPGYRIKKADFLLTLGADILETFITPVSFAGQVADRKEDASFTWTHIEPHVSLTGMNATNRLTLHPGSEPVLLRFLLRSILGKKINPSPDTERILSFLPALTLRETTRRTGLAREQILRIVNHFAEAKQPLLITGGVSTGHGDGLQTALLTVLIQWSLSMNEEGTIDFSRTENYGSLGTFSDLMVLMDELEQNRIGVLFLSRANPIHAMAQEYHFPEKLAKADLVVAFTDLMDETAKEADLILPLSHPLESWGDAEPQRGIHSLIRPALRKQYDTFPEAEILLQLQDRILGRPLKTDYAEILRSAWHSLFGAEGTEAFMQQGYRKIPLPERETFLDLSTLSSSTFQKSPQSLEGQVLIVTPSIRTFDGRSRPLSLLYEVPDPLTTITYGKWASIGERTATSAGLTDKDRIVLKTPGGKMTLAAKVQPGLPEGVLVVQRDLFESAPLPGSPETGEILQVSKKMFLEKTGGPVRIPVLSGSTSQHGRGLIPMKEIHHHERISLYPPQEYAGYRWAMAVDLDRCTGCAACVAACYVENNVPIVGRAEHLKGREMSWLRIEPYYNDGRAEFLPMMCQQCDDAPCETVCPVYAAYHNPEGLNVQVYNRCVGTRYCSNNCPYKVRRFNWFEHRWEPPLDRMINPEIFVRWKGVMEKCSFCIQRIRKGHDTAKDRKRKIRDGEVIPACGESCPAGAITFGNLLDRKSRVHRLAHSGRAYRVFDELGTEPAVYYLRKV
ncbi:MAG: 4Fe-4S dicluster domain-containing protein [Deltaproteobacteria bacterium]|nr:4Fe-4S dicluster domain-containing protein [Deltaproteobacteria bacterium]